VIPSFVQLAPDLGILAMADVNVEKNIVIISNSVIEVTLLVLRTTYLTLFTLSTNNLSNNNNN